MARKRTSKSRQVARTGSASDEHRHPLFNWVNLFVGILATFAGIAIEGYFNLIQSHLGNSMELSNAVYSSSEDVEEAVMSLTTTIRRKDGVVTPDQTAKLRRALLLLREKSHQLNYEVGMDDAAFKRLEKAMVRLISEAEELTNAGDSPPFVEALGEFYSAKQSFEAKVSSMRQPKAT